MIQQFDSGVRLKTFIFNPFQENTFVLYDTDSGETAVVDPGNQNDSENAEISSFISEHHLKVKYLINTHGHIDHIFGNQYIKSKYEPIYYAPEFDVPLIEQAGEQAQHFQIPIKKSPQPDKFLSETEKLTLGDHTITCLFTPGHTPGEYCLYVEDAGLLISGDVLFRDSIGRTDLWGGDLATLLDSIKSKLFPLPPETKVYPGHGGPTTIGEESENNPFFF